MYKKGERSFFVEVFGDYPLIRVLDFLLTFREFDYPLTEIAENSSVGLSTIHSFCSRLVELGIIIQTCQAGGAKLYKLNIKNPVVQELIRLDDKIAKQFTDSILREEEHS